jgi:predicted enzyme related to lactoylglutathione lyase
MEKQGRIYCHKERAFMKRVTGLGGMFIKSKDPKALFQWYEQHLGIQPEHGTSTSFHWRDATDPNKEGQTVFALFPEDTKHFTPSQSPFMMNFRVDDLAALLDALRAEGVQVDPKVEEHEYGKFAWIMDPDGNRIELWEPPE